MGTAACAQVPENKDYVSVREAAWRSSMSEKTIRNIIRNDALPHYRNGRSGKILLLWSDFVACLERRKAQLLEDGDPLLSVLRDMNRKARQ
jgi:hypothetical protein